MLTLDALEVFIPNTFLPILSLEKETKLSRAMLSVFKTIYGLKQIPVWQHGLVSLMTPPMEALLSPYDTKRIDYLFYPHTVSWSAPYGDYFLMSLKKQFHLNNCQCISTTVQKCVSYFLVLEMMQRIFSIKKECAALVITGEIAFTPQLRVVPHSSIVGDMSTAALFSSVGQHHILQSVINHYVPGFSKGIYLSVEALAIFDAQFIARFCSVIEQAILAAHIALSDLSLILPHNVNLPTWKKIAEALRFPLEKIYLDNIGRFAHGFCSDHCVNLKYAIAENRLKKRDYYLMAGCGLGFYFSAAVFQY